MSQLLSEVDFDGVEFDSFCHEFFHRNCEEREAYNESCTCGKRFRELLYSNISAMSLHDEILSHMNNIQTELENIQNNPQSVNRIASQLLSNRCRDKCLNLPCNQFHSGIDTTDKCQLCPVNQKNKCNPGDGYYGSKWVGAAPEEISQEEGD